MPATSAEGTTGPFRWIRGGPAPEVFLSEHKDKARTESRLEKTAEARKREDKQSKKESKLEKTAEAKTTH